GAAGQRFALDENAVALGVVRLDDGVDRAVPGVVAGGVGEPDSSHVTAAVPALGGSGATAGERKHADDGGSHGCHDALPRRLDRCVSHRGLLRTGTALRQCENVILNSAHGQSLPCGSARNSLSWGAEKRSCQSVKSADQRASTRSTALIPANAPVNRSVAPKSSDSSVMSSTGPIGSGAMPSAAADPGDPGDQDSCALGPVIVADSRSGPSGTSCRARRRAPSGWPWSRTSTRRPRPCHC